MSDHSIKRSVSTGINVFGDDQEDSVFISPEKSEDSNSRSVGNFGSAWKFVDVRLVTTLDLVGSYLDSHHSSSSLPSVISSNGYGVFPCHCTHALNTR